MNAFLRIVSASILTATAAVASFAQQSNTDRLRDKGWEFEIRTGVNIGGTTPLPIPAEVREIIEYNPNLNGILEVAISKWFLPHDGFGVMTGLRLEQKGMETTAAVKNYHMTLTQQGTAMTGNWTGVVRTAYSAASVTVPLLLAYNFHDRGKMYIGFFGGYNIAGDFSGDVYDGYFRQGSPIGEKIVFSDEDRTPYSFKDALRSYEIGFQFGGGVKVYRNFGLFADFKYGFNNIFKKGFDAVAFGMYPAYIGTGFSYVF